MIDSTFNRLSGSAQLLLLIIMVLSLLFVISAVWFASLLSLGLSFCIKTYILYRFKWGEIKECLSSCFKAYFVSFGLFIALIIRFSGNAATIFEVSAAIRETPEVMLFWQTFGFIVWIPFAVLVEGGVLHFMARENPDRKPWESAILSNVLDSSSKLILLSLHSAVR